MHVCNVMQNVTENSLFDIALYSNEKCIIFWMISGVSFNDLLAVPAPQLSLLAEVRTLIASQDLERFDGQVLHREMEAWRARHGGPGLLHPDPICITHPEGHIPAVCQLTTAVPGYSKARGCASINWCNAVL